MLTEICATIRNYFSKENERYFGKFAIENGAIVPSLNIKADYIRICGSRRNDGVHKLSDNDLVDEIEFDGAIWEMSPPPDFLALVEEIETWQEANGTPTSQAMSPYNSESFGGYSYTKSGAGAGSSSSGTAGWLSVYGGRLNIYRKMRIV